MNGQPPPAPDSPGAATRTVLIGLLLCLSLATLDVLWGTVVPAAGDRPLRKVMAELASSVVVFTLLYLLGTTVLLGLAALPLRSGLGRTLPLLALGLGLIIALGPLKTIVQRQPLIRSIPGFSFLQTLYVTVPLVMLTAVVLHPLTAWLLRPGSFGHGWSRRATTIPVLLLAVLAAWLVRARVSFSAAPVAAVGSWGTWLVLVAVVVWAQQRVRRGIAQAGVLGAISVSIVLLGVGVTFGASLRPRKLSAPAGVQPSIRHVILLTADSLRVDALSTYAPDTAPPTPNLDALAADSVVFEQAVSPAPWTLPAFASIMTGLPPTVHQMFEARCRLPDYPTLASRMAAHGYVTSAVGYSPMMLPPTNMGRGFMHYDMYPKRLGDSFGARFLYRTLPEQFHPAEASTAYLTTLAVDWLKMHQSEPFFFWLHYFDPHLPYELPPEYVPQGTPPGRLGIKFQDAASIRAGYFVPTPEEVAWLRKLYDAEVRYMDDNVGRLVRALKRLGIYDDALIVFTSDHGEEFLEHGGFEHGHSVYDELLRVPLMVKLPQSAVTRRIARAVTTESLTPTVLDVCGVAYDPAHFSSRALAPLWGPQPETFAGGPIISTGCAYFEDQIAVRFDGKKYIKRLLTQREELYDLSRDPGERVPLLASLPDVLRRGRAYVQQHAQLAVRLRRMNEDRASETTSLDEETIARLRSLGYLD